eukprot:TRINITY_DN47536_c0_g1_i1.p1 TRINITY_DN47536_c0_g1~~TRINITY_DN47536_c0_g1_i1.p1  ORF type:complete len:382 (+),score=63.56 TRINITY_DN47536_c0_g1_i1:72-1148(+)
MPGWFAAFLVVLAIGALVAIACCWRRQQQTRRSRALASDFATDTARAQHATVMSTGGQSTSGLEADRTARLRHGTLMWKYHFAQSALSPFPARGLRRIALVGRESIFVSRRDAHRSSHVRRKLTESDHHIALHDVLAIQLGPLTSALASAQSSTARGNDRSRGDRCFSILCGHRSYDLEALTDDDLQDWVIGIQRLTQDRQTWAGLPLHTPDSLARAQSAIRLGRLPKAAFEGPFPARPPAPPPQVQRLLLQQGPLSAYGEVAPLNSPRSPWRRVCTPRSPAHSEPEATPPAPPADVGACKSPPLQPAAAAEAPSGRSLLPPPAADPQPRPGGGAASPDEATEPAERAVVDIDFAEYP